MEIRLTSCIHQRPECSEFRPSDCNLFLFEFGHRASISFFFFFGMTTYLILISEVPLVFFVYFISFFFECVTCRSHSKFQFYWVFIIPHDDWSERDFFLNLTFLFSCELLFCISSQVVWVWFERPNKTGSIGLNILFWVQHFIEDDGYLLKQ